MKRELIYSGRLRVDAAHTAVLKLDGNEYDVDIYVYFDNTDEVENKNLRAYLKKRLIEIYPSKDKADFKLTKSSAKVIFRTGIKLNIDLVPVVHLPNHIVGEKLWGYIPRPNGERRITNVPKRIDWVREKTGTSNSPTKFNKVVRLMKWWRTNQKIKYNSYTLTVLAGNSFLKNTFHTRWDLALIQVFNHYHTTWTVQEGLETAVRVRDPINHDNNITNDVSYDAQKKFKEKAKDAEDYISKAYSEYHHGDKDKALQYLNTVFGSKFKNSYQ